MIIKKHKRIQMKEDLGKSNVHTKEKPEGECPSFRETKDLNAMVDTIEASVNRQLDIISEQLAEIKTHLNALENILQKIKEDM